VGTINRLRRGVHPILMLVIMGKAEENGVMVEEIE
jgi:hypothetical protein